MNLHLSPAYRALHKTTSFPRASLLKPVLIPVSPIPYTSHLPGMFTDMENNLIRLMLGTEIDPTTKLTVSQFLDINNVG